MDVIILVGAIVVLVLRGPELARFFDSLWDELTREEPKPSLTELTFSAKARDLFQTDKPVDHVRFVLGDDTLVENAEIHDDSERRARIHAYRAGQGMRPK